ncbi:MAG: prepilin peptidase [Lachnospiraceae bacterium]|nr:prepilin peptidase [Lachnospiraceae bacterium]
MLLLVFFLLLAVRSDLKTGRIPNRLIVTGFVIGVVHTAVWHCGLFDFAAADLDRTGLGGLFGMEDETQIDGSVMQMFLLMGRQFAAMMIMLIALIPFWKVKAFGGGDVKMACVSVWYIGFAATVRSLLYAGIITTVIAGGLVAVEHLTNAGVLSKRVGNRIPKLNTRRGKHIICFSLPYLAGVLSEYVIHSVYLK